MNYIMGSYLTLGGWLVVWLPWFLGQAGPHGSTKTKTKTVISVVVARRATRRTKTETENLKGTS